MAVTAIHGAPTTAGAQPLTATDWARWTPDLPQAGWHDVYVWYTDGTNRAPDAVYTVHHQNGETQLTVDQTQAGGQWNQLGSFSFAAGTGGLDNPDRGRVRLPERWS